MWLAAAASAAPPTAEEVARRFAADGTPKSFQGAMEWVAADPDRPPAVLSALAAGRADPWVACAALETHPQPGMGPVLAPFAASPDGLVRHACTRAYVEAVVRFGAPTGPLEAQMEAADCLDRQNAAVGLGAADPAWAASFAEWLGRGPTGVDACSQVVAAHGLSRAPAALAGPVVTRIYADDRWPIDTRDAAGLALVSLRYAPAEGALAAMLVGPDPGANLRSWAIRGLREIGTPSVLPALEEVIRSDPFGGVGVWAVEGREAKAAIEARAAGRRP